MRSDSELGVSFSHLALRSPTGKTLLQIEIDGEKSRSPEDVSMGNGSPSRNLCFEPQ